jgi:hypothetical protein
MTMKQSEEMTKTLSPNRDDLAKASLWAASAGLAFPVSLVVLAAASDQHRLDMERLGDWPYALGGVLFVIVELVALGCGIAARYTRIGRFGLAISVLGLILLTSTLAAFGGMFLPSLILQFGLLLTYTVTLLWRTLSERPPEAGSPEAQTDRPEGDT